MTESLQQRIAKEAEERYPLYTDEEIEKTEYELPRAKKIKRNDRNIDKQIAYVTAATLWAERLEAIRDEVEALKNKLEESRKRCKANEFYNTAQMYSNQHYTANEILVTIINKHL